MVVVLFCLLISCPPDKRPEFFGLKTTLKDYKINYGLDLKGGSELLYQIDPHEVDPTRTVDDVLADTIEVISQRIYESRIVKDPRIQQQGTERILIQLPGLNQVETEMIKKEIETLGNLEFRLAASRKIGKELDEQEERTKYEDAKRKGRLPDYERNLLKQGYRWFASRDVKSSSRLLWVNDGYNFTGTKFSRFFATLGDEGQVIGFELKEELKASFARFTELYKHQRLAIVFNNKVVADPQIRDRIPGSGVMVGFQPDDLKQLLKVLRSGSLEIQPELLNENTIGPSLGEDTINLGILAGVIGATMVVVFMSVYYLMLGVVASIACLLNILAIFAVMVITKETLTLPGIAGIMLTIGMSVDANVLIYERIREERNKRLDAAEAQQKAKPGTVAQHSQPLTTQEILENCDIGYDKAFSAIFDSNVTTLITAIILYVFASGPVQGFAFTLGVGLIANFITAITCTKVINHFLIETGVMRKLGMLAWLRHPRFPFARCMGMAMAGSILLIVLGMSLFISRGDANYGLDLKGGILAHISLEKPLPTTDVRKRISEKFNQLEVQHIETAEGSSANGWYQFAIRLPNTHQQEIEVADVKLRDISKKLRPKNEALQNYSAKVTRMEEEQLKEATKELQRLEEEKASKEKILDAQKHKEYVIQDIEKYKDSIAGLSKEVDQLKKERSDLIVLKNKLAGIEELRHEIEGRFKAELSPMPFGKLVKADKGKWTNFHQLPLHMANAVSGDFIRETLKANSNFKDVELGSLSYYLLAKYATDPAAPEAEIPATLLKHLELTARVSTAQITAKKVTEGASAGYFAVNITFSEAVPEFALREVIGKCGFQDTKLSFSETAAKDQKSFHLFLVLPWEISGDKSMAELQSFVEENINTSLKDKQYQEAVVYLSNPFPRFTQLSGVVAEAQKAKAVQAIFLSLIALLLYIVLRFPNGFRFGLGATLALAHNVLVTLGAIAACAYLNVVNVEIDLTAISALLMLLGYSINDTIVVFDRIRENRQKNELWNRMSKQALDREMDLALNQTLSRTMITGSTSLMVLVVMFILNWNKGSVIEGFSFILTVGIIVGTYSSIFIATSIVLMLEKRDRVSE